jgi:high affinity Mn2+ porin
MSHHPFLPACVIGFIAQNRNKSRRSSVSSYWSVRKLKYCDARMNLLRCLLPSAAIATVFLTAMPSFAADPGVPSGFYFGGHVGYGFGNATATLADPIGVASSGGTTEYGMLFGGVQGGYQQTLPSRWMWGVELDFSFPNYMDLQDTLSYRATNTGTANEQLEFLGTFRGRLGYAMGAWTPFVTGGVAFANTRYARDSLTNDNEDALPGRWRAGYSFGGGVDYALGGRWSARAEYLYTWLGLTGVVFTAAPARYDSQYDYHRFRVALNYHFGDVAESKSEEDKSKDHGPGSFELHGQSTFIVQGYPPFNSPFQGQNSLPGDGQSRETWSTSAFLGVRLWQGGELYYNPELLQGFGLANTVGAAGFPNGEAQKSNFAYPRYNTSRLFLRQEWGLGGEREKVEGEYGQLSGEKDVKRVTVQVGKFAVHDVFDTNDYAQDNRVDFMNWAMWASGAYDYAADRLGLTYGITAELNYPDWAVRAGYFLMPTVSNGNLMDWQLFARGGYVTELELRLRPFNRPGVYKAGLFLNSVFAGSYNDAVTLANTLGVTADNTIAQTRQSRIKFGYYLNVQQEIADDIGLFARWSWNNGQNEIVAFTDIDESLSFGISIKGTRWKRPDDTVGIGFALDQISTPHINFLAAGGFGPLVGDGQLPNYKPEKIIEAYYSYQLIKGLVVTADYQLIADPAYDADRGPVHVFSGRLRASF